MNWLSSLGSTIWDALSKGPENNGSILGGYLANAASTVGNVVGGAANLLGLAPKALAPEIQPDVPSFVNPGSVRVPAPANSTPVPAQAPGPNSTPVPSSTPVPNFSSVPEAGSPTAAAPQFTPIYSPVSPTSVRPLAGVTGPVAGTSGMSGSSSSPAYVPPTNYSTSGTYSPQAGTSGLGGGSNGRVTGFSSAGTSASLPLGVSTPTQEDQNKKSAAKQFIPGDQYGSVPQGLTRVNTPQGGSAFQDVQGNTYLPTNGGFQLAPQTLPGQQTVDSLGRATTPQIQVQPNIPLSGPPAAFNAGTPGSSFDLGNIQNSLNDIQKIVSSGNFSQDDVKTLQAKLGDYTNYLVQIKNQQSPVQGPSAPTPESLLKFSSDPTGDATKLQQIAGDQQDAIYSRYGVPRDLTDIKDIQSQIEAETEAYQKTIEDIKNNPDLPTALAGRRVQLIKDAQSTNLQALQVKYQFMLDKYNMDIGQAKDALGLSKDLRDQNQRQQDSARQTLSLLVSSGGIAAMNDSQLSSLASQSGLSLDQLKAVQSSVTDSKKQFQNIGTATNANGDVTIYGVTPQGAVTVLNTLQGAAKGTTAGGDAQIKQQIMSNINSVVDQYKTAPDGFREKYISQLVGTYGAQYKDYISGSVYNLLADKTPKRFLPADATGFQNYFTQLQVPQEKLLETAKAAGFNTGWFTNDQQALNNWYNSLNSTIDTYRKVGYNDADIAKLMGLKQPA